ncbi:MAG TPA: ATP-binding protein [Casimicrobiaceae bacterium]|nr:ATP-binding protein [Casimicrobiaceae bacterium]
MVELIRTHDWANTPIGPEDSWSPTLRMMVGFLLANRFPLLLWWGPRYIQIYNDAYRPVLGTKHPRMSLGKPCNECWSEIWHVLKPLIDTPFEGGPATWLEDLELEIHRHGFKEESHFTIAYSRVPDNTAPHGIGGVLATVHEITEKVIGERRIYALRELGTASAEAKTVEQACRAACAMLAKSAKDVPFALIYLLDPDGRCARLAAKAGFADEDEACPRVVELGDETVNGCPWPIIYAVRRQAIVAIEDLPRRLSRVPPGPWADPPHAAVLVPIRSNTAHQLAGVLVAGVSSRLTLNDQYMSFYELVAAQVATTIANARAYEDERKRAEALAEIDRAKTAFFSNVSHEFRTPLGLLLGPIEEAVANTATPQPVRTSLELAHRNALRLLKLVNSLLDFARIEAGRVEATYEPTDLAAVTTDLASNFRSAIERAGLALEVECEALDEPAYVDREMWEKIVLNLLSNAFKFVFDGSITVRLHREASEALLEVSDTGVGIPEQELSRVFERFHRVEGTIGRTQEGSGIGLALVHELVKLHGGTISVQSRLGLGTTFLVRLPLGTAHLPPDRIRMPRTMSSTAIGARAFVEEALRWIPESETTTRLVDLDANSVPATADRFAPTAGAHILLADDNADMRAYLRDLLAPTYNVETVVDGEEALAAARRARPDLILCDVMMPRLDGLALLRAARADDALRDIPVVLLSARAGEEARVEGLDAGADDYLVKPFSARELLARIGTRLELVRMRIASDKRFRTLVSATSEVIYRMSPDWTEMRFLEGRDFIADTEDSSRSWLDKYIHPDDQSHVMAVVGDAIRAKSVFQLEHRVRRIDGSWGWTFSRAIPLLDVKGNIVEWFGAASDVTARRQAECSLREREQALAQAHEVLKTRTDELARFNRAAVGRELRIIELKRENNELRERLGEGARYPLDFEKERAADAPACMPESDGLVPLEQILRTDDLRRRPARAPDYEIECRALTALVKTLADSPRTILQRLADEVLEVLRAGSAGLSILTPDGERFYWAAIAGAWSPHLGGGTPRGFGPCGDVLDRNEPLLFTHWERRYPYLATATPLAEEGLLVPFHVAGHTVGTIWAIAHDRERRFDVEDLRLLESLGGFASAAYEALQSMGASDERRAALSLLEDAEHARALADESLGKLRESERQLFSEAGALSKLNEYSARMWRCRELHEGLDEMLASVIDLVGSDKGNVQLLNDKGVLTIEAQRGFDGHFLDFFREVSAEDDSACGRALRSGEQIVIEDVEADEPYAPLRPIARAAGYRAVVSTPLISGDGVPQGMLSTHFRSPHRPTERELSRVTLYARQASDFIRRCKIEGELRRSEEELREADRRKNEFLALLGHELRNPLAPISTAGELLSRTVSSSDANVQTAIDMIRRQAAQLARLVDDLLDVARITQGRIQLQRAPLELGTVIAQAVETVAPLMLDKQQTLAVVKGSHDAMYVNGDLTRLVQCVVNLLANAAKYTDRGGRIEVHTRAEGARAVIEVIDNGPGIAPELLPELFHLFVQGNRTLDRAEGGLGIGLSVVKRLIEMHDGEVTARSAGLGHGAAFAIRLPRIAAPASAVAGTAVPNAPRRRVLIVDDNQDAANALAMVLSHKGHETRVVYSARSALELVASFAPDVALLDIGLAEMDGYDLARHLRARSDLYGLKLVAVTGYGQAEDRERSKAAGFDDHIIKPVDLLTLERAMTIARDASMS